MHSSTCSEVGFPVHGNVPLILEGIAVVIEAGIHGELKAIDSFGFPTELEG